MKTTPLQEEDRKTRNSLNQLLRQTRRPLNALASRPPAGAESVSTPGDSETAEPSTFSTRHRGEQHSAATAPETAGA